MTIERLIRVRVVGNEGTDPLNPLPDRTVPQRSPVPGPRNIHRLINVHVTAGDFDGQPGYPENLHLTMSLESVESTLSMGEPELDTQGAVIPDSLEMPTLF